jgi:hypothetical protein
MKLKVTNRKRHFLSVFIVMLSTGCAVNESKITHVVLTGRGDCLIANAQPMEIGKDPSKPTPLTRREDEEARFLISDSAWPLLLRRYVIVDLTMYFRTGLPVIQRAEITAVVNTIRMQKRRLLGIKIQASTFAQQETDYGDSYEKVCRDLTNDAVAWERLKGTDIWKRFRLEERKKDARGAVPNGAAGTSTPATNKVTDKKPGKSQ